MASENEAPRPDPYAILGIYRAATPQEIRRAYRRKTKATHPDRFDKTRQPYEWQKANQKQAELNRAYATLRSGRAGNAATQPTTQSPQAPSAPSPRKHAPRANRGSGAQRATEGPQDQSSAPHTVLLLWCVTGVSLLNGAKQSVIVEAATAEEAAAVALAKRIRAISIAPGPSRLRPTLTTYRLTPFGRKAVVVCILAVVCLVTAWAVQLTWCAPPVSRQSLSEFVGRSASERRIPAPPSRGGSAITPLRTSLESKLSAGKLTSPDKPKRLLNIDYRAEELWRQIVPLFMPFQAANQTWTTAGPGISFPLDVAPKDGGDPADLAVPTTLPDDPLTPSMDLLNRSKPTTRPAK